MLKIPTKISTQYGPRQLPPPRRRPILLSLDEIHLLHLALRQEAAHLAAAGQDDAAERLAWRAAQLAGPR